MNATFRVYFKDGTSIFTNFAQMQKVDLTAVKMIDAFTANNTTRIYEVK